MTSFGQVIASIVKGVVYIVSRFIKVIALIVIGAIAIGILASLLVGHMGLPYVSIFSPSPVVSGYIGYYAGIIAFMIIPLILIIRMGMRVFSGYKSSQKFRKSIGGIWIVSFTIFALTAFFTARYYDVENAQQGITLERNVSHLDRLEINVNKPEKYRNLRKIHLGDSYLANGKYYNLRGVKVRFFPTESDSLKVEQKVYSRGMTFEKAKQNTQNLDHQFHYNNGNLKWDSYLTFNRRKKYRGQHIQYNVYVPIGKEVHFNDCAYMFRKSKYRQYSCYTEQDWVMTTEGLELKDKAQDTDTDS